MYFRYRLEEIDHPDQTPIRVPSQYVPVGPLRHPVTFFQYGQNLQLMAPNSDPRT
jgi:hypothetical protein